MAAYEETNEDVIVKTESWSFDHPAVHREYLTPSAEPSDDLAPDMARHPSMPFVLSVRDDGSDIRPRLFEAASIYINRIAPLQALGLSGSVAPPEAPLGFGWLPLAWDEPNESAGEDARGSFWVRRANAGSSDRTAVLLAGNRGAANGQTWALGGSVGLRVALHVGESTGGRSLVRIVGFSLSELSSALLVSSDQSAPAFNAQPRLQVDDGKPPQLNNKFDIEGIRQLINERIKTLFGFDKLSLSGLRYDATSSQPVQFIGEGVRDGMAGPRVFSYSATWDATGATQLLPGKTVELVTHLIKVVSQDPASQGPANNMEQRSVTRSEKRLGLYRHNSSMLPAVLAGQCVLDHAFVKVLPTRVGNELVPAQKVQHAVPKNNPKLRSDDLSAVHAFLRGRELLQRFEAYGLVPGSYFRMAKLPLLMQHRASFRYASNGETTNAQVSPDSEGQNLFDPYDPDARPHLKVSFGSANLSHREMLPNNVGQLRAQPMGMAADPRWAWHEFGHVLNFASTGELEFRFAHSAGDALAAIVGDVDTQLKSPDRMRHLTFPWARLTRSHGRPAHLGWCWCGSRSRLRHLAASGAVPPIPGGYWEEQLMSSSLFRLYCAIGGDSSVDHHRRASAADYCVYLIMQAISLLGPAAVVPARSADQFVSALIDADVGTDRWLVNANWPEGAARVLHRRGGAVHKVIRWAFERQGLYAATGSTQIAEGPGLAPAVDVYIPGRRPRDMGEYEPVDLSWSHTQPMPWHADSDGIFRNGSPVVKVKVGNRGSDLAMGVSVKAWASRADGSALKWQPLLGFGADQQDISGDGGATTFSFQGKDAANVPLKGNYFVLAAATCEADRANTDASAALPCGENGQAVLWTDPALLTDLVANDNNLGLRIIHFE